jgi:hypothetical protein
MRISKQESNYTEIEIGDNIVLFSYTTPVAILNMQQNWTRVTDTKWSKTTSTHINKFKNRFGIESVDYVSQEWLDHIVIGL